MDINRLENGTESYSGRNDANGHECLDGNAENDYMYYGKPN